MAPTEFQAGNITKPVLRAVLRLAPPHSPLLWAPLPPSWRRCRAAPRRTASTSPAAGLPCSGLRAPPKCSTAAPFRLRVSLSCSVGHLWRLATAKPSHQLSQAARRREQLVLAGCLAPGGPAALPSLALWLHVRRRTNLRQPISKAHRDGVVTWRRPVPFCCHVCRSMQNGNAASLRQQLLMGRASQDTSMVKPPPHQCSCCLRAAPAICSHLLSRSGARCSRAKDLDPGLNAVPLQWSRDRWM